jgi:hypothetical protein
MFCLLRWIFGPKKDEVTTEWRRLHKDDLYDVYSPQNVILVIKVGKMRWAGYIARLGGRRGAYRVWWRDPSEGHHLEDLGVDGRTVLS